jgi:hypothetical protein
MSFLTQRYYKAEALYAAWDGDAGTPLYLDRTKAENDYLDAQIEEM